MGYKVKISDYAVLPDGLYPARFVEIAEREGENGPYLFWHFEIVLEDENRTVEVTGLSSAKFGPQTKGRSWLDALLSEPLEAGEEIDFDSLKQVPCQVYLTTATTSKGAVVNRVDRVIPAHLQIAKSKAKQATTVDEGEAMDDEDDVPF
jgi:hypothetical protein